MLAYFEQECFEWYWIVTLRQHVLQTMKELVEAQMPCLLSDPWLEGCYQKCAAPADCSNILRTQHSTLEYFVVAPMHLGRSICLRVH